jgi:hypothetical protein
MGRCRDDLHMSMASRDKNWRKASSVLEGEAGFGINCEARIGLGFLHTRVFSLANEMCEPPSAY